MPAPARLRRDQTILLIVDVQEKLLPAISGRERVERNCVLLARAAVQLRIPILLSEQYPEKLGSTLPAIREAAGDAPTVSKMRFSACGESTLETLRASHRKTVLLCGVEAHVCVLQTTLDLLENQFAVFVAHDAISSRTADNSDVGWQRLLRAGAIPTSTESAIFELLQEAGTPDFKALLPLIK